MSVEILNSSKNIETSPITKDELSQLIGQLEISIDSLEKTLITPVLTQSMTKSSKHKFLTSVTVLKGQDKYIKNTVGNVWDESRDGYLILQLELEDEVKLLLNYSWIYVG